ncbi:MAG: MFS transporter, partial [Firmicutes bacterium]|nr:MFS transporter [Bacillota bacterium]
MRKSLQLILFLKAFLLGTIAPIFILLLTARGATLETVSLFVGLASLLTLVAEFPSGVFAGLFGRKRSFLLSVLLQLGAYALLLLLRSALSLAGAMVLYGLSRAFVSGSIEALVIDEAEGKAALVKVTSRLNVLESAGLAAGSLLSGALATLGTEYTPNILFNVGGYVLILILT